LQHKRVKAHELSLFDISGGSNRKLEKTAKRGAS
jgi:hypothetical protein